MKTAALEKDRLENRQRSFRKFNEARDYHPEPKYFTKWRNPSDNLEYFVYNDMYFEHDRPKQDWSRLPDIYSDNYPDEIKPFIVGKKE